MSETKEKPKQGRDATGDDRRLNMIEAINDALDVAMGRDDNVVVFGEDAGYFGGVFRCTAGLQEKYGKTRAFDTPISECGIIATAIGMGAYGLRPVPEIQFADYIYPGYDQIISEAARLRYRSAGEFSAPITIRSPFGGGIFVGQTHSQSPESLFTHASGIKTVIPATPRRERASRPSSSIRGLMMAVTSFIGLSLVGMAIGSARLNWPATDRLPSVRVTILLATTVPSRKFAKLLANSWLGSREVPPGKGGPSRPEGRRGRVQQRGSRP